MPAPSAAPEQPSSTRLTQVLLNNANSTPSADSKPHYTLNGADNFLSEFVSQFTTISAFFTSVCGWEELLSSFIDEGLGLSIGGLSIGIPLALFFALCEKRYHDAENINAQQNAHANNAANVPQPSQDVSVPVPPDQPQSQQQNLDLTSLQKLYNRGHYVGELVGSLNSWVMLGEVVLKSKNNLAWRLGKCGFYTLFSIWKGFAKRQELENGVVYFQAENKLRT